MRRNSLLCLIAVFAVMSAVFVAHTTYAQVTPSNDFSLQVTPSPIVTTLKPGTTTELELKIRNAGTGLETLKIEPRSFKIDDNTGQVQINDTELPEIASWISYSAPTFTVRPGEWFTEKVRIAVPKDAGFSYWFTEMISRTTNPDAVASGGRLIKGSLGVFTLINIDRPGATRRLEVDSFGTTEDIYEYLPATLNIKLKNTGNTIVQPSGNVFIERGSNDTKPLAVLSVNDKKGYILPGSSRLLQPDWNDGFPSFDVTVSPDGSQKKAENWDWSKLSHFRIGSYTAKLVAVYNDGERDVPLQKEVSFWVLPWKIILGAVIVCSILLFGVWSIGRKMWALFHKGRRRVMRMK